MKKLISSDKSIKRIYLVMYDQQEFLGHDISIPIKAFKTKKQAEIYANTRNFEFQSVCLLDEEDYENYVLGNNHSDYIISISDFKDAYGYIQEEMLRLQKNKIPTNVWDILSNINPFKIIPIEYMNELKNN